MKALLATSTLLIGLLLGDCSGGSGGSGTLPSAQRRFPLNTLPTTNVTLNGTSIKAWLAVTPDQREEGLMFVSDSEISASQGMLFVFPNERDLAFWMKNTLIPLDIAFARADGTIVATHTMPPLTLESFPSIEPAMFALELKSGVLGKIGAKAGDKMIIPSEVLKNVE